MRFSLLCDQTYGNIEAKFSEARRASNPIDSVEGLRELVKAVNQSNVPREEWLSESVYEYKDAKVRIA